MNRNGSRLTKVRSGISYPLKMNKILLVLAWLSLFQFATASEHEVTVNNEKDNIRLAGTLAIPDSLSPKAFVVLASGSGAQNRDEEVMGQKPFKVLSDALVSAGYGVLRMDDRGVGESEGVFETAVLNDFKNDVISGVNYLRQLYPSSKIGIIGHSQGGQIAVKAAAEEIPDFIITLAGPAWQGDSLIMSQCRALAVSTTGSWPAENLERSLLDIAMSDMPVFVAKSLLVQELAQVYGEAAKLPQIQKQLYEQVEPLVSPMYRDLLRYDPHDDITAVKVPWLALNGDKDLQVLPENLRTFKELNQGVTTIVIPGHNHLFQPAVTGLPNEYPTGGQSPSDTVLGIIISNMADLIK